MVVRVFARVVKQAEIAGTMWEDSHFMMADVPLKVREAEKMLPLGMKLTDPPLATLFIADYHRTGFTVPYRESAALIHVKTLFGAGLHCCWMHVNDDTALIYGRELLGYPKKMAEIEFEETPHGVKAGVTRRGVTVLSMVGSRGAREPDPGPVAGVKTFNIGGMGQTFVFNPVWLLRYEEVVHESYVADVKVELNESDHDPLTKFLEPVVVSGRMAVIDILGARYLLPVGLAGVKWLSNTFSMRMR
jgi:acetoacetate decarboxylase